MEKKRWFCSLCRPGSIYVTRGVSPTWPVTLLWGGIHSGHLRDDKLSQRSHLPLPAQMALSHWLLY